MASLILNNGVTIEVDDSSTSDNINVSGTIEYVGNAIKSITTDTINHALLYDVPIIGKIVDQSCSIIREGDVFTTSIFLRQRSWEEEILERLNEQDAALIELAELIIGG